ncbi:pleckstrin homology-like domain family A member 3 isoform X2 [Syngnathoides biaculeatus]|nr:pleckstrin homology-like domain family A member 3 isoform X2 [Syngnathoides biaculeatus]
MSVPVPVRRDGLLEKRSGGLLQLWKKKRCVLTDDGLRLSGCAGPAATRAASPCAAWTSGARAKELPFECMATVDCVEYKRDLVYFTVVMASGEEIDFRCPQDGTAWNAEIALALVRYKNLQAVRTGKKRRISGAHLHAGTEDDHEL